MEQSTIILIGLAIPTILTPLLWTLQFIWLHFVHKSHLEKYLVNDNPNRNGASWALVTGASDGIGFGFVQELAARGFNVILHGRNKSKLEGLITQVQAQYPSQHFKTLTLDATEREKWQETFTFFIADELQASNIKLRVLINNVGGSGGNFLAFDRMVDRDPLAITKTIDMNATFPTAITHALLPHMTNNPERPALILTIGSVVGIIPPPYLALYAGSKAFNAAWSDSLHAEMRAESSRKGSSQVPQVEVLHVLVGRGINAATTKSGRIGSLFEPTPRVFAQAALQKVGCGISTVTAYWPHDLQILVLKLLPRWIVSKVLESESIKEMESEKRNR